MNVMHDLQNAHSIRVAQNVMCLVVETFSHSRCEQEVFKVIIFPRQSHSTRLTFLEQLLHTLLGMSDSKIQ